MRHRRLIVGTAIQKYAKHAATTSIDSPRLIIRLAPQIHYSGTCVGRSNLAWAGFGKAQRGDLPLSRQGEAGIFSAVRTTGAHVPTQTCGSQKHDW